MTLALPTVTPRSAPPLQSTVRRWRPRLRPAPRRQRAGAGEPLPSSAGLIVITGPSMSGKSMLGHYLHEYLPRSVHVSQVDPVVADLRDQDPEPLQALLKRIRSLLRCGRKVVFSARLCSAHERRRVLGVAAEVGVPRLLVELDGTDPDTLEQATEVAETLAQVRDLLAELKQLLPRYRTLTAPEQRRYSTLTVPAEEPVEEQVKTVLDGWAKLGTVH